MRFTYSFEKLEVWQKAKELVTYIYKATEKFPDQEQYSLTSQMRRCAISITSNISEGAGRKTNKAQKNHYQIANSSTLELINQIILARELEYIKEDGYHFLREKCETITRLLNSLYNSNVSSKPLNPSTTPLNPSTPKVNYYVHPSAIIEDGAIIGNDSKIWHFCHIMNATIGAGCSFGQNVFVADDVIIGNNVKVQNNVSIYKGVVCEDDVFLGPSMVLTNVINPRSGVNRKEEYAPTLIKKGASIGANATIVCGNTIGRYAFIGAATVITKDVPDYALMVGNPGKQLGWMSAHGHRLKFDADGMATCAGSGEQYQLSENIVVSLSPNG